MKYKICEYERGNGEKYYTVSRSNLGLFWVTLKEWRRCDIDCFHVTRVYESKEHALKAVECQKKEDAYRKVKRNKCEIV